MVLTIEADRVGGGAIRGTSPEEELVPDVEDRSIHGNNCLESTRLYSAVSFLTLCLTVHSPL